MSEGAPPEAQLQRQPQGPKAAEKVAMGALPKTMAEGLNLATVLARSDLVPVHFRDKPANVYVALEWGASLGLSPLAALNGIAVINGRASMWGDALLATIIHSGQLESIDETVADDGLSAVCSIKRKGFPKAIARTFTMAQAKRAGLLDKRGPWTTYPERMLQMRARAFCIRDVFPDVLNGLAVVEEQRDVVDVEAVPVPAEPMPKPLPATEAAPPKRRRRKAQPEALPAEPPLPPAEAPTPSPETAPESGGQDGSASAAAETRRSKAPADSPEGGSSPPPPPSPAPTAPPPAETALISKEQRQELIDAMEPAGYEIEDLTAHVAANYQVFDLRQLPADLFETLLDAIKARKLVV